MKNERYINEKQVSKLSRKAEKVLKHAEKNGFVCVEFDDGIEDYQAKKELIETVEATGGKVFQTDNPYEFCFVLDGYKRF